MCLFAAPHFGCICVPAVSKWAAVIDAILKKFVTFRDSETINRKLGFSSCHTDECINLVNRVPVRIVAATSSFRQIALESPQNMHADSQDFRE